MILVIGGAHQGKLDYVKEHYHIKDEDIFDGEQHSYDVLKEKKVIKDFHLLVRRLLIDNIPIKDFIDQALLRCPETIIISNEIGYGIVPMEQFERTYREETGRICCYIAGRAKKVVRMTCGIATVIKNEEDMDV